MISYESIKGEGDHCCSSCGAETAPFYYFVNTKNRKGTTTLCFCYYCLLKFQTELQGFVNMVRARKDKNLVVEPVVTPMFNRKELPKKRKHLH